MDNIYSLLWGFKLRATQKIALSGLFIALSCILNKVLAINYIPSVPFVRVSFGGPAVIIFSSFLLGPIYGSLIGALQDILGFLVFDIKAFPYSPTITTTYALLGLGAGFLFYFLRKFKNPKLSQILTYTFLGVTYVAISLFIILNDQVVVANRTYNIALWMKIAFPILMLALFILLITFIEISHKKNKFNDLPVNTYQLTLGCFILEVFIMTLYGSLMKSVLFGFDLFIVILFCQTMTMFFNIPFNVIVISFIMNTCKRYFQLGLKDYGK